MSAPRRVVFDTSTLVGAALQVGSVPHRALTHALSAGVVFASESTLAELDQVLLRPKFNRYALLDVRRDFAATLRRLVSLVAVSEAEESNVHPPCRDPKDNKFLALVKVCEADALIGSDSDLLVMHPWHGVPILTPSAYVALTSA
ncbi:MAG: putative toxin-antitoxin system toxin component, PIN family [Betaproteobacteria bacterium]|nr:putative toxin-antitoxin system toxin component, PIN family [Betaproteobacteria bacterium]